MPKPWPDGGPWVLVTTSTAVDWQVPAAVLAAASRVRVAALVLGADREPDELLLGGLATCIQARDGGTDPLSLDEAAALVQTLAQTHGLVLVVGVSGLLVPVGRAGWTLADLAAAVHTPVVVVTDAGPDSVNHTALALDALAGRHLTAAVVVTGSTAIPAPDDAATEAAAVGDDGATEPAAADGATAEPAAVGDGAAVEAADPGVGDDPHAALPVAPAGRIPVGAAEWSGDFTAAARSWLDPVLHASAGRRKTDPPPEPQPVPPPAPRATTSGTRVVLLLGGAFVTLSLLVCGLAFCNRSAPVEETVQFYSTLEAQPAAPPAVAPTPRRVDPCPEQQLRGKATVPDATTTRRVNAAWKRIETWLAAHAPATRRSLRPPATDRDVARVQERMSVAFPADLVASLRRHNGVTDGGFRLPFLFQPLSATQIAQDWAITCSVAASVTADSDWWNKAFVPFATAGDGGCLLVDQRPGGHGRVGEFYPEDGVDFTRWPGSVTELLERTAQSLETGRPYDNRYRPRATAGVLEWDIL